MKLYQKLKLYFKIKILNGDYIRSVRKAQKYGNAKHRVFVVINPNNKLVLINRQSMRWFRNKKWFEQQFKMRELRKQSVYYYPAYPEEDADYEKIMAIKKEQFIKQMLTTH